MVQLSWRKWDDESESFNDCFQVTLNFFGLLKRVIVLHRHNGEFLKLKLSFLLKTCKKAWS